MSHIFGKKRSNPKGCVPLSGIFRVERNFSPLSLRAHIQRRIPLRAENSAEWKTKPKRNIIISLGNISLNTPRSAGLQMVNIHVQPDELFLKST